jgi:hypothetical protein
MCSASSGMNEVTGGRATLAANEYQSATSTDTAMPSSIDALRADSRFDVGRFGAGPDAALDAIDRGLDNHVQPAINHHVRS